MCCRSPSYNRSRPYYDNCVSSEVPDYEYCQPRRHCPAVCRESDNTYYVDPAGKDCYPGSLKKPFRTIQRAIDVATEAYIATGYLKNIEVAFGRYTENLTITKPIQLTGATPSQQAGQGCIIYGNIAVNVSGTTIITASQVAILGFQINGSIIDGSTTTHTLLLQDLNIIAQTDRAIYQNSTSTVVVETHIINTNVTNNPLVTLGTSALLEVATGVVAIDQSNFAAYGIQSVFTLSGNATTGQIQYNVFVNRNSGSSLPAVILISTSAYTSEKNFFNNTIAYSSSTAKVTPVSGTTNTGIYVTTDATAVSVLTLVQNYFNLQGVSTAAGNYAVNFGATNTTINIYYADNTAAAGTVVLIEAPVAPGAKTLLTPVA